MTSNPVLQRLCGRCGAPLDPPLAVTPGRPRTYCSDGCKRQAGYIGRRAQRWERLAAAWRQRSRVGATAAAERCEAIALKLRERQAGVKP